MERMASQDTFEGKGKPLSQSVTGYGLISIMGTAWVKPAGWSQNGGYDALIQTDKCQQHCFETDISDAHCPLCQTASEGMKKTDLSADSQPLW
jgi:hypothetical protein